MCVLSFFQHKKKDDVSLYINIYFDVLHQVLNKNNYIYVVTSNFFFVIKSAILCVPIPLILICYLFQLRIVVKLDRFYVNRAQDTIARILKNILESKVLYHGLGINVLTNVLYILQPEAQKLTPTYCSGLFMLLRPVVLLDRNASSSFLEPHQNTTLPKKPSDSFFFVYIYINRGPLKFLNNIQICNLLSISPVDKSKFGLIATPLKFVATVFKCLSTQRMNKRLVDDFYL